MNIEKVLTTGILAAGFVAMIGTAFGVVKAIVDQNKSSKLYIETLEQSIETKELLLNKLRTEEAK